MVLPCATQRDFLKQRSASVLEVTGLHVMQAFFLFKMTSMDSKPFSLAILGLGHLKWRIIGFAQIVAAVLGALLLCLITVRIQSIFSHPEDK